MAASEVAFEDRKGLSVEEAGDVLGVGRSKIYNLIQSGALPARKIGRRTIILREDALKFLERTPVVAARAA